MPRTGSFTAAVVFIVILSFVPLLRVFPAQERGRVGERAKCGAVSDDGDCQRPPLGYPAEDRPKPADTQMSYSLRRLSGSDERTYSVISAAGGRFYSAFTEPTFHAAKTG